MTEGLAEAAQPSTDELRSFDIGLRDGLMDAKHVRNMGSAVWLYMWYVRKQNNWAFLSQARVSPAIPQIQPHSKSE
jgi:hypothetical protein